MSRERLLHRWRYLLQWLAPPRVAIIGAYHCGNLGDLALGQTALGLLPIRGAGLQTIYSLPHWPHTEIALVGGGAILTTENIKHLVCRYGSFPERLAIVGVDVEDTVAIQRNTHFFDRLAYFSVRSKRQAMALRSYYGLTKVVYQPDLCFAIEYPRDKCSLSRGNHFAFNVTPRFHINYHADNDLPEAVSKQQQKTYETVIHRILAFALSRDYNLTHLAFTPQDDYVARYIVGDNFKVHFVPYRPNVTRMLRLLNEQDIIFASRYHSLIFSLVLGRPTIPFLYADKSYRLIDDLGLSHYAILGYKDLLHQERVNRKLKDIDSCRAVIHQERLLAIRNTVIEEYNAAWRALAGSFNVPGCA